MAKGRGVITGDDVFKGVVERAKEVNAEMERMIGTFNKLDKSVKNAKNVKQAVQAEKQYIQVQKEGEKLVQEKIKTTQQLSRAEEAALKAKRAANIEEKTASQLRMQLARESEREANSLNKLKGAYAEASKRLTQLRNEYKNLATRKAQGEKLDRAEIQRMKQLQREVVNLDKSLKRIDSSVGQFQRSVGNYSKAFGSLAGGFRSFLGAFGFTSGIYLFASAIKNAFKTVKEFDQAQANLAAILGKTKDGVSALTNQAQALGATTAFTATQVSNLQLELAKLGFNDKQIIDSTRAIENFAIATGAGTAEAAKLAGAAVRSYQLETSDAARVAEVLAVATTRSASSFQTLEVSLPKVASIANALNFSLEETTALLSILQNAGFEASISGTSLRQIFAKLADDSSGLQKALGGDIKTFDQLIEGFAKLKQEGIELNEVNKLVPIRAAAALNVLIDGSDDIKVLAETLKDSKDQLQQLADTKLDSLEGSLTLATSAWDGLVISIENGSGPLTKNIRGVVDAFTGWANALARLQMAPEQLAATYKEERANFNAKEAETTVDLLTKDSKDIEAQYEKLFKRYSERVDQFKKLVEDKKKEFDEAERLYNEKTSGFFGVLRGVVDPWVDDEMERVRLGYVGTANALAYEQALLDEVQKRYSKSKEEDDKITKTQIETLESLRAQLEEYKKELDGYDLNDPVGLLKFKETSDDIERLEKRIKQLTGKQKSYAKGTVAWYDEQIRKLKQTQSETSKTALQYANLQKQIEEYQLKKGQIENGLKPVETVQTKDLFDVTTGFGAEEQTFNFSIFGMTDRERSAQISEELRQDAKDVTDGLAEEVKRRQDLAKKEAEYIKQKQQEIKDAVADTFASFAQYYGVDLQKYQGLFDGKKNTVDDWQNAIQESTAFVTNLVLEGYQKEIESKKNALDAILASESSSEEQKKIAKEKFQKEEAKLREKQYKAERDALTFQVIIDTAAAVTKILLQAGIFSSNPVTAPIAAQAYTQAGIAAALGAAQVAFIRAQKPPKFFQGKDKHNRYEGLATWGERRPEVLIDKQGNISVSPNKTTPLYVKQDDLIVPSIPQFHRDLQNPNSDVRRRVVGRLHGDTKERTEMFRVDNRIDLGPLKGLLSSEIRKGFKNVNVNVRNNILNNKIYDRY